MSGLVINTIFEHNKAAMAYLDKGVNNITVTFDNPQDLAGAKAESTKLTLSWTATGDDGMEGTASAYELRCSTRPITAENFEAATLIANVPSPKAPGSEETVLVRNLESLTTYYFASKVKDEGNRVSAISNIASGTTLAPDSVPPWYLTDLR